MLEFATVPREAGPPDVRGSWACRWVWGRRSAAWGTRKSGVSPAIPIAPPGGPGALGGSPAAAARGAARAEDKVRLARGGTGEHAPVVQDNEAAIEQFPQLDVLARPAAPAGAGR